MIKTEKKYFGGGHQIRGGWFNTYNFNILSYGFMIVWGKNPLTDKKLAYIKIYKLI